MNGPKPLPNTEVAADRRRVSLDIVKAMRAGRPHARAVPAPKPSWVAELPRDLARKSGQG